MESEPTSDVPEDCLPTSNENTYLKLRVAGIFIILATSLIGTLFPIFAKRSKHVHVPKNVFEFAKFFGSGIIIATAFIHLMAPAFETLGSECLKGAWGDYPWAPAIAMISIFLLFFVEFFSFRFVGLSLYLASPSSAPTGARVDLSSSLSSSWGTSKLEAAGFSGAYDQHGHNHEGNHAGHGPEPAHIHIVPVPSTSQPSSSTRDPEHHHHLTHSHSHTHPTTHSHPPFQFPPQSNDIIEVAELPVESSSLGELDVKKEQLSSPSESTTTTISGEDDGDAEWGVGKGDWMKGDAISQILGIAILEFGVVFHSFFIGLTLATDPQFVILFIVIVFHQTFEGLGLGSRLAFLPLPRSFNWVPVTAGTAYAFVTPIGMAIGLGVRHSYQGNSVTALVTSGVLDSISAGILLWTGLVELLAHEFLFSEEMQKASNGKVFYAMTCMCFGAGIMALLGRWA